MSGIKADSAGMQDMAGQLRSSTTELSGMAGSVPPAPQVTSSSEAVGQANAELLKAMAGLVAGVEDTASNIHASDGSYAEVDNDNARNLTPK